MNTQIDKDLWIGEYRLEILPAVYPVIYKGKHEMWNCVKIYVYILNHKLPVPKEFDYSEYHAGEPTPTKPFRLVKGWCPDFPDIPPENVAELGGWNDIEIDDI